ncbi:MAG: bacterial Ig-like domain-containing protein [Clostridia bacterium]|nr:bacterial Ig-like domain-containing protein [Clostridia bacterium]
MKLQNKKNQTTKTVVIAIVAVVLIVLIIGAIFVFGGDNSTPKHNATDIVGISMSAFPKMEYYVGEELESKGAKVQVLTYDMTYTSFVEYGSLTFSGFDSSTPVEEQVITVSYKGFTTTFTVTIKEIPQETPNVESFEIFDFKTTITMSDWNEFGPISLIRGSTLKIVYSDGTMGDPVYVDPSWVWGYQKVSQPGTFDLTIKYNNDGTLYEKVVTITITN